MGSVSNCIVLLISASSVSSCLSVVSTYHCCKRNKKKTSVTVFHHTDLLGSISSYCSGNEPALLLRRHGLTRETSFVNLNQSDNRPQIFVGHKLSCQFGLRDGTCSS